MMERLQENKCMCARPAILTPVPCSLCAVNTDSSDQTEPENDSDVAEEPISDDRSKAQTVTSFVSLCGEIIRF